MSKQIKLSKRLQLVASLLPKGANFADIGSDHAYLPCFVCMNDPTAHAISGEINQGPYESAKQTVLAYNLTQRVDVRLGDGLSILDDNEVNEIVIAGMGGSLITSILEAGKKKLDNLDRIIVQPNIDERSVRQWFMDNGYTIESEKLLEENGHLYEIICARKNHDKQSLELSEKDLLFGPILRKNKSKDFMNKWLAIYKKQQRIIKQMERSVHASEKRVNQFKAECKWMEEELQIAKKLDK